MNKTQYSRMKDWTLKNESQRHYGAPKNTTNKTKKQTGHEQRKKSPQNDYPMTVSRLVLLMHRLGTRRPADLKERAEGRGIRRERGKLTAKGAL